MISTMKIMTRGLTFYTNKRNFMNLWLTEYVFYKPTYINSKPVSIDRREDVISFVTRMIQISFYFMVAFAL